MNKKTLKRQRDLKTKLMAAISMLLVSSLMMVTSTYAWFTLSTAPEVTGITTAVGANGNLEMALLPADGNVQSIKSEVGNSIANTNDPKVTNITWGNLVDLKEGYGLDEITLFPAQLNATIDEVTKNPKTIPTTGILSIPTYGADGRINKLVPNTVTSTYVADGFPQNSEYGVRAVGTASGMTERQLAYRNARTYASTAIAQAKDAAANSLSENGNALADIAIKHGTDAAATHTQVEVQSLIAIVDDLLGSNEVKDVDGTKTVECTTEVDGIIEYIEEAYRQYILAYGASQKAVDKGLDDGKFILYKAAVESAATLDEAVQALGENGVELPDELTELIAKLKSTREQVEGARLELEKLVGTGDKISWNSISTALYMLANPDDMEVNTIPVSEIKSDESINHLIATIGGGLTVSMKTGGGVYADVADHCGNYSASIVIKEITYGTTTVKNLNARMATETTVNPVYLTLMGNAVDTAAPPTAGNQVSMPITDMYGYIIDLAFRTNATESNLLLQQEAADRIYDVNGNEETMGHGSSMTFLATTTDFSDAQVEELMNAIRIVFFQPGESSDLYNVVATAKLDTENTTKGADGITAMMYLYRLTAAGEPVYTKAETYEEGKEYYIKSEQENYKAAQVTAETFESLKENLYTKIEGSDEFVSASAATFVEGTTYYQKTTTEVFTKLTEAYVDQEIYTMSVAAAGEEVLTDNEIMPLIQNTATQLSVLVYLDGNHVTNGDVAATAATSVTGTMNLQFASSANLVPMEYADLHLPVTATNLTAITVTGGTDVTAKGSFDANGKTTITLAGMAEGEIVTSMTIGGTTFSDYEYANGSLTFTKADIKAGDAIAITVGTATP